MKKEIILSLLTFLVAITNAQITGSIDGTSYNVYKENLIGFNLGGQGVFDWPFNVDRSSNGTGVGYNGEVFSGFDTIAQKFGPKVMYRFFTGEGGNYYNRWYSGWGSNSSANYYLNSSMLAEGTSLRGIKGETKNYRDMNTNAVYQNYNMYNLSVTPAYQTSTPANPKNNVIFPFIKLVTNGNVNGAQQIAHSNYMLNILEHYRDFRNTAIKTHINGNTSLYGVVNPQNYSPRKDLFLPSTQAAIKSISTISQLNSSLLSQQFKDIVNQNIDGILTLLTNKVSVKQIELGNEIPATNSRFVESTYTYTSFLDSQRTNLLPNDEKVYYRVMKTCTGSMNSNTISSIDAYANLSKMYIKLVKNAVFNLYNAESDPTTKAFYLDIYNNLKFGMPVSGGFPKCNSGHNNWDLYMYNNYMKPLNDTTRIGFDAFIYHAYSNYNTAFGTLSFGTSATNKDSDFTKLKNYVSDRFKTYLKTQFPNDLVANYPGVNEIWFTEWEFGELKPTDIMSNTLLHGMTYIDEVLSFLDFNANRNLVSTAYNKKDVLKLANHHFLWLGNSVSTNLLQLVYGQSPVYRTAFFANKLLTPIFQPGVIMGNQDNGGINATSYGNNPDVYFRTFIGPGTGQDNGKGYCNIETYYIYYSNKSTTSYTMNLNNVLQPILNSILPTAIGSVRKSQIYADKLYASRGKCAYNASETISADSNITVQINDNVNVSSSSWNSLPIRKYSTGYYKVEIVRQLPGGCSSSSRLINPSEIQSAFSLYPNPTRNTITFDLNLDAEAQVELFIMDKLGRTVRSVAKQANMNAGNNSITVDVKDLAPGMYLGCMRRNGEVTTQKFIVQQ